MKEAESTPERFLALTTPAVSQASRGALGSKAEVEVELDAMLIVLTTMHEMEPDEAMKYCSGFSARCAELCVHLHRVESRERQFRQVRTMQVRVVMEAIDLQFKIASRLLEVRRQDLSMMGGQV